MTLGTKTSAVPRWCPQGTSGGGAAAAFPFAYQTKGRRGWIQRIEARLQWVNVQTNSTGYSAQEVFGMTVDIFFFMGCFSMGIWWRCDGYTPDHPMGARRSQAKPRALALPFGGMATRSTCHVIFFWRRLKLECGCNHFSEWRIRRFSWLQVLLTTWICESTLLLQLWLLLSSCCIWIPHKSTCSEAGREENHWKPLVKNPSERGLANVLWINLIKLSDS